MQEAAGFRSAGEAFDLHEARNYWRFAPSGVGKVDSATLLSLPDEEFYSTWERHFKSRLSHYWEEGHTIPYFAELFRGKKVLSFGSGLGLNEMQFLRAGADLTCADIVESNLRVIERVAAIEGVGPVKIVAMKDSATTDFGGPYDYIYANGSLMTMPFDKQAMVVANFKKSLKPDGRIILMLYTWKFVADTCGVDSPKAFARYSDPSVGDIHNPWSDWHDDRKLMQLAGDDMAISARQFWNQGYYVWFVLDWARNWHGTPGEILPLEAASSIGEILHRPSLSSFEKHEADLCEMTGGALSIRTTANQYLYAAWSAEQTIAIKGSIDLFLDVDLQEGGVSVSLLDLASDRMIMSRPVNWQGRHFHVFPIDVAELPVPFRFVLSNFQQKAPASSRFTVHDLAIVKRVT